MTRVLIVEDDPDIALSLRYALEREGGFSVRVAGDGESGLAAARSERPELVVLDLNLPRISGLDLCRALRAAPATAAIPIIMLTARVDEADRVTGLELGADDYVTKPFSVREVVARVRAVLRRTRPAPETPGILRAGPLEVDEAGRRVRAGGVEVALTRKEFDLLAQLLRRPGRVFTREALLEQVWGYDHPGETRTVDVHVRQLRRKLGPAGAAHIETVVGVGYRMKGDE